MCNRYNIHLYDSVSNFYHKIDCRCYMCEECGPKKVKMIRKRILLELNTWHYRTMWTFTAQHNLKISKEQHYEMISYSFQRAIWDLRRYGYVDKRYWLKNGINTDYWVKGSKMWFKGDFKYIRVNELHEDGYSHLHVILNQFIPFKIFKKFYHRAMKEYCDLYCIEYNDLELSGIQYSKTKKRSVLANYISKYITKTIESARHFEVFKRFYSKSRNVVLMNKRLPKLVDCCWYVLLERDGMLRGLIGLDIFRTSPQNFLPKEFIIEEIARHNRPPVELLRPEVSDCEIPDEIESDFLGSSLSIADYQRLHYFPSEISG
jgi:hypothetical protein